MDFLASPSYKVRLDKFQGPLDLLLFFIKRDELDIYDIPINGITKEFLEYLRLMQALDLEIAGEFIVVAAELCQIKAKMLLPREESEDGQEEEDPRADLVRRLIEYRRFKEMSQELGQMSEEQKKVYFRQFFKADDRVWNSQEEDENLLHNVTLFHLLNAFKKAMERAPRIKRTHDVEMIPVSVEEQSEIILTSLETRGELTFTELFSEFLTSGIDELSSSVRLRVAVTFIAILDLVRNQLVALRQHDVFDEIILFKP
jgi:segregation and condensation protein A